MVNRALVSIAVILHCSLLWAGEFKGEGYSLTLPDGWTVADKVTRQAVEDAAKSQVNLDRGVDAMFYAPDRSTNVNVGIRPGSLPVTQGELPKAREALLKVLASGGIKTQLVDSQIVQPNGRDYFLFRMDNSHPAFPELMRQWMLFGSAGGKVYTFTFSTPSKDAGKWDPTFNHIVQSITLQPGGLGSSFFDLPGEALWVKGIMAGLTGGLVAVVMIWVRKRVPPTQPPVQPPPEGPPAN